MVGAAYTNAMEACEKLRRNANLSEEVSPGVVTSVLLRRLPAMSQAELDAPSPPLAIRRVASLPYERLLLKARNLYAMGHHGQGQHDAACEVAITEATQWLIAVHAPRLQGALEGLIGNSRYSLSDARVADLWDTLAGDTIRQATFWRRYLQHLRRRNGIVHAGKSVPRKQADESIEVAQAVCDHVTERSSSGPTPTSA